jgi:hypothetical protein
MLDRKIFYETLPLHEQSSDLGQPAAKGFGETKIVRLESHLLAREKRSRPPHTALNFIYHNGNARPVTERGDPLDKFVRQLSDPTFTGDRLQKNRRNAFDFRLNGMAAG